LIRTLEDAAHDRRSPPKGSGRGTSLKVSRCRFEAD